MNSMLLTNAEKFKTCFEKKTSTVESKYTLYNINNIIPTM